MNPNALLQAQTETVTAKSAMVDFVPPTPEMTDTRVDAAEALAALGVASELKPFGVDLMTDASPVGGLLNKPNMAATINTTSLIWNPHTKSPIRTNDDA